MGTSNICSADSMVPGRQPSCCDDDVLGTFLLFLYVFLLFFSSIFFDVDVVGTGHDGNGRDDDVDDDDDDDDDDEYDDGDDVDDDDDAFFLWR